MPEEPAEPIAPAAVEEPTPVPLGQVTVTVAFDLPDTPTPAPTATPTVAEETSSNQADLSQVAANQTESKSILFWQHDAEDKNLYRFSIDQRGRALTASAPIDSIDSSLLPDQILSIHPSPRGDLVAVVFGTEGGEFVYLYDFASDEFFPLVRDIKSKASDDGHFLGWSHDSQFALYRPSAAPEAENGVLLVEVTTGQVQLLIKRTAYGAAFSPDGKFIILDHEVWENDTQWGEVWLINQETKEESLLFKGIGFHYGLTWSPDGKQIAYIGDCSKAGGIEVEDAKTKLHYYGLCLMNPDGTNRRLVTLNFVVSHGFYPIWAPDSRHLAFATLDGPPAEKPNDGPPPWNEMAFTGVNIHVLDTEAGEEWHLLADSQEGNIDPAWSPDGSQILFTSQRSGSPEIWRVNLDGTNLQQLTFDGRMKRFPLWSK